MNTTVTYKVGWLALWVALIAFASWMVGGYQDYHKGFAEGETAAREKAIADAIPAAYRQLRKDRPCPDKVRIQGLEKLYGLTFDTSKDGKTQLVYPTGDTGVILLSRRSKGVAEISLGGVSQFRDFPLDPGDVRFK